MPDTSETLTILEQIVNKIEYGGILTTEESAIIDDLNRIYGEIERDVKTGMKIVTPDERAFYDCWKNLIQHSTIQRIIH